MNLNQFYFKTQRKCRSKISSWPMSDKVEAVTIFNEGMAKQLAE